VRFRERKGPFASVAAVYSLDRANIAIDHRPADPRPARIHLVTGDYFTTFGVTASAGRLLSMSDERALGAHPVAVISDAYRRGRFADRSVVLGHTLTINGTTFTIVGIAPPSFTGDELGEPADLWIPLMMQSEVMTDRPNILMTTRLWLRMVARLEAGMTTASAARDATGIYRQKLAEQFGGSPLWAGAAPSTFHITLESERRGYAPSRGDAAEPMLVVLAIVILVLTIACVNVAALLLVRSASRDREVATRLALGASTARVSGVFLAEGMLIGALATGLAVAVAAVGVRWLERVGASGMIAYRLSVAPDGRVIALLATISALTMLVCGLVPARRVARLARGRLHSSMALGGQRTMSHGPLGNAFVAAEVALTVMLVTAAGLFVRTLVKLEHQEMGFDRDHMLEAFTEPDQINLGGAQLAALFEESVQRIALFQVSPPRPRRAEASSPATRAW
jgi:hypothetical protein